MANQNYTKIPNELLESIYSSKLSSATLRLYLYIIRHTIGFHRKTILYIPTQIQKDIKITKQGFGKAKQKLLSENMIQIYVDNKGNKIIRININTEVFETEVKPKKKTQKPKITTAQKPKSKPKPVKEETHIPRGTKEESTNDELDMLDELNDIKPSTNKKNNDYIKNIQSIRDMREAQEQEESQSPLS